MISTTNVLEVKLSVFFFFFFLVFLRFPSNGEFCIADI